MKIITFVLRHFLEPFGIWDPQHLVSQFQQPVGVKLLKRAVDVNRRHTGRISKLSCVTGKENSLSVVSATTRCLMSIS
jgi:hypothetical protein